MVRLGKRVGFSPSLLALAALSFTLTVSCGRVFNDGSSVADSRASNLTDGTAAGEKAAQGEKSTIKVSISTEGDVSSSGLNLAASMLPQLSSSRWLLQGCDNQPAHESILKVRGLSDSVSPAVESYGREISGGIEVAVGAGLLTGCRLSVESFDAMINGESITYVFDPYSADKRKTFFGDGLAAPVASADAATEALYYASPSRGDNLNVLSLHRIGAGLDPAAALVGDQKYVVIMADKGNSIIAKGPANQAGGSIGLIAVPVSVVQLKLKKGKKLDDAKVEVTFSCLGTDAQCTTVQACFIASEHAAGSGASLSKKDLVDKFLGTLAITAAALSGFSAPLAVPLQKAGTAGTTTLKNKEIDSSKQHYLILKYQATDGTAYKYYPVSFGSKSDFDSEDNAD